MPQQVGINRMVARRTAGVWPRRDAGDAHLAHVPLHRFAIERDTLPPQLRRDPS